MFLFYSFETDVNGSSHLLWVKNCLLLLCYNKFWIMSPDEVIIFAQQSSWTVLLVRTCGHHISYNVLAFSESQGTFSMLQLCTSMLRVIIYWAFAIHRTSEWNKPWNIKAGFPEFACPQESLTASPTELVSGNLWKRSPGIHIFEEKPSSLTPPHTQWLSTSSETRKQLLNVRNY